MIASKSNSSNPTERHVDDFSVLYFPASVYPFLDVDVRHEAVHSRLPNQSQPFQSRGSGIKESGQWLSKQGSYHTLRQGSKPCEL